MKITRLIFLFIFLISAAATTAQKVAIIGLNGSSPDGFSIVVGEALSAGEIIFITDKAYAGSGSFATNESHWKFETPAGGLSPGDVIAFAETMTNVLTLTCNVGSGSGADCGTVTIFDGVNIGSTGEILYAYSDSDDNPNNGVTEVYSIFKHGGEITVAEDPSQDHAPSSNAVRVDGFSTSGNHRDFKDDGTIRENGIVKSDIENPNNYIVTTTAGNTALSVTAFASVSLPVELVNFDARPLADQVILNWSTASEFNNMGFEIEKSQDAREWESLDFVEGFGSVNDMNHYSFIDEKPFAGINYYRLKQMDYNGTYEYSAIATAQIIGNQQVTLYPTVTSDEVQIKVDMPFGKRDVIEVYNIIGKKVQELQLPENDLQTSIDISNLEAGHYLCRVLIGTQVTTKRIIKK